MDYICTWICVDGKNEESYFPQTGKYSSSKGHQAVYWRCIVVFYLTSLRFNATKKHLLFTNSNDIPDINGMNVQAFLESRGVEIIYTDFKYRTPQGYYFSFQNQFYEFSILEHIVKFRRNKNDTYLILDSDCVFLKSVDELFVAAAPAGFISFEDDVLPDYVINGLSRNDLKEIYEEILLVPPQSIPAYHLGEFFLAKFAIIERLFSDFLTLWPILLQRHADGKKKFNEEAHTLSFLYFKNDLKAGISDRFMKRIWTNPVFYRNAKPSDIDIAIWHLPAEKLYSIRQLYNRFIEDERCGSNITNNEYRRLVQKMTGVPHLSPTMLCKYYVTSYYRAILKRSQSWPFLGKLMAAK